MTNEMYRNLVYEGGESMDEGEEKIEITDYV